MQITSCLEFKHLAWQLGNNVSMLRFTGCSASLGSSFAICFIVSVLSQSVVVNAVLGALFSKCRCAQVLRFTLLQLLGFLACYGITWGVRRRSV